MIDTLIISKLDSINNNAKEIDRTLNHQLSSIKNEISQTKSEQKIFGVITNDTAFTLFITLGIFILGILIERLIKYFDRKSEEAKLKEYFIFHLNEITTSYLPPLVDAYKKFYETHNVDTGIPLSPPILLSGDLERILKIENNNLFHSFKDKKQLSKILSQIDFLERFSSQTEEYHKIVLAESNKKRQLLNNIIQEYTDAIASIIEGNISSGNPHITFLNDKLVYYHKNFTNKRELSKFYAEIVQPIQEFIVSNNLYATHDGIRKVAVLGKELTHSYNDLKNLASEITEQYKEFHTYLITSKNKIIEYYSTLK